MTDGDADSSCPPFSIYILFLFSTVPSWGSRSLARSPVAIMPVTYINHSQYYGLESLMYGGSTIRPIFDLDQNYTTCSVDY